MRTATQRTRLYITRLIEQYSDGWEWLEELWEKQPETNGNHPFGKNKQIIAMEKLYGITQPEANKIIQTLTKLPTGDGIKELLINKLK